MGGASIYVIVGIDAGIKTGYAVLDLNGRLVASGCEKEASDERLVRVVSSVGIPVLVASDTSPASHFVQKVAARFNVRVFVPSQSLAKVEKRHMGQGLDDPHVRDSYAAALKAYRSYQNRLRQIDSMQHVAADELKKMVITGERIAEKLHK